MTRVVGFGVVIGSIIVIAYGCDARYGTTTVEAVGSMERVPNSGQMTATMPSDTAANGQGKKTAGAEVAPVRDENTDLQRSAEVKNRDHNGGSQQERGFMLLVLALIESR